MHDYSKYPKDSLLAQLIMDVYATEDSITILYDRPFTEELLGLEFDANSGELYFDFTPGRLRFGVPLKDEICDVLEQQDKITLIHMDIPSHKAISGMEVPLTVVT